MVILTTSQFLSLPQCPQSSQFTLVNCVWSGAESWEAKVRHLPILVHVQSTTVQSIPRALWEKQSFPCLFMPFPSLFRGPNRYQHERDWNGCHPPTLLQRLQHQAGRPLGAIGLCGPMEGECHHGMPLIQIWLVLFHLPSFLLIAGRRHLSSRNISQSLIG